MPKPRVTHYYPVEIPYNPRTEEKFTVHSTAGLTKTNRIGTNVSNPTARVIGDQGVLLAVQTADKKHRQQLLQLMRNRASEMQTALRNAALLEYNRAGTGRFARGIKVKGQTTQQRGYLEGKISISIPQYRESRFLTNLGGNNAYFQTWPVGPYFITAKGVTPGGERLGDLWTELRSSGLGTRDWNPKTRKYESRTFKGKYGQKMLRNPLTGHTGVARRTLYNFTKKSGLPRLKVPFEGLGSLGARGGSGRGKNAELLGPRLGRAIINFEVDKVDKSEAFYYPLWVEHPGFKRDVITETAQRLLNESVNQWQTLVLEYQRDITATGGKTLRARVPAVIVKNVSTEELEARQWTQMARGVAISEWRRAHPGLRNAKPGDFDLPY